MKDVYNIYINNAPQEKTVKKRGNRLAKALKTDDGEDGNGEIVGKLNAIAEKLQRLPMTSHSGGS